MKRFLIGLFVVAAGLAAVGGYAAASREREYRKLVAAGDAALARDDTFVALEEFSGAIALRPGSMLPYLKRGEAYYRRGELHNARRDLRMAASLDTTSVRVFEALGDVNYALKDFERATDRFEDCLRLDDSSPRVQYKLGLAYYHAGQPGAALKPLGRAVAMDPADANAEYVLGLALRDLGRTREAIAALKRSITLSPAFAEPRSQLATIYGSLGRSGDEIEQLEALAALGPAPERAVALGLAYARAGRTSQAVVTLGNATERFPDTSLVYVALGRVWLQSAQARDDRIALSKAVEALEGALTTADPTSEALALFGRAVYLSGDVEAAEQTLLEAVARMPIEPLAFLYLADAAQRLGHAERAKDALVSYRALFQDSDERAERLAPAVRIADLAMKGGDAATAARWYRRAADGAPASGRILRRLVDAAIQAGDPALARASLKRALELRPGDQALLALANRVH